MAAGGVDVLRRRDSRFPSKDFGRRENVSRVNYGGSRYENSDSRQNRFRGRTEDRKLERFGSSKDREESRREDDKVQLPSEKKRKFSPVVWDEQDARVSSKKRVTAITPSSDTVLGTDVLKSSVFQSEILTVEGSVTDESVVTSRSSDTELLPEQDGVVQKTREEIHEEEVVKGRTISMSRWASDDDSPQNMSDGECSPNTGMLSSPESGEFQRESSSADRERVSSSEGDARYSEKELSDVEHGETDGEDCQIEEPSVSAHQHVNMLQSCRNVFEYERLNKINEGTYGVVYKARDKKTGEIVALKKVKMDVNRDDGFPLTSLREINILSSFCHPSVVEVKEVAMDDFDGVYMVMEYLEHDLKGLMEKMKERFSIGDVKWLMMQLLEGVKYLHDNWVLHRDLKTSNLLISKEGRLKVCDFGLSRQYGSPLKPYTPLVVTLWYRAPELLLGTKEYSTAIDMWSVGCIMAELVAKAALFRGKTEVEQLDKIFSTLGTPNETIWPGLSKLPGSKANFSKKTYKYNTLRKKFPPTSFTGYPALSDLGFDLLSRLLTYDPAERITAEDALNHKWFVEAPLPRTDFKPSIPSVKSQNRYHGVWQ